eukprot:8258625-Pyramimonas_sp.AAC.1
MVSRKRHAQIACNAGAQGPPPTHSLWCRESAMPAVPCDTTRACCVWRGMCMCMMRVRPYLDVCLMWVP